MRLQVSSLAISVIDQVPHANSPEILELSPPERLGGKRGADRAERSDRTRPIARKLLIRRPSWWIMDVEAGFGSRPVHSGFKP